MSKLMPRQPVPGLEVATLDGGPWRLADQTPANFTMVVFYRGLHCPICGTYIRQLDNLVSDFEAVGVSPIAISSDSEERARQSKERWHTDKISFGYGLDLDMARAWGLYISSGRGKTSIGIEEPALFSEPGLFLVRPDGTLFGASVNTMPFARPHFDELLKMLGMIIEKNYPARGEVA